MSKLFKTILTISMAVGFIACTNVRDVGFTTKTAEEGGYTYEYVTNDPLKTRIYTLDNGLKVYLSVYKDEPRAQVLIPVKAGGKNDPATNTGLAHYLEHMMFKGNDKFGTLDYEKEKVFLDSIENMFNHYATLTDEVERKEYYKLIDNISNQAAELAIPNEYDKMISEIGGKGLNAYTSEDRTVYMVDVPANNLDKHLKLEASRFSKIVNRLFHTELEAVYEEKNRSLDTDGWKVFETMYGELFKEHKYGTQTVIGTIEHLKNPSITEIEKYFYKNYRPNNVAICISGDIDPTATMKSIDAYFSGWEPNNELVKPEKVIEAPITEPRFAEVYGPDAEQVDIGFRFDGRSSEEYLTLRMVDYLLANSTAGLIDLNLMQQQKVLFATCSPDVMNDYTVHTFWGNPKDGQSLDEVKDLLLGEIEKLKNGDFEDWLLEAVITDFKKSEMRELESNYGRANKMVMAFTNDIKWEQITAEMDYLESLTKQDIIDFVNKNYGENYAVVYKREGQDPNKLKVEKPQITKVPLNREAQSQWHTEWSAIESPNVQPVFVDYEKDIDRSKTKKGINVLATTNTENELFELIYLLDVGSNNNPKMKIAVEYLEFLGTDKFSSEELKKEFYKLGCNYSVSASSDRTYVTLEGLDENMEVALELFESLINEANPDAEVLAKYTDREIRQRSDAKKNKGTILFSGLMTYGQFGSKSSFTNVLSNNELLNLEPEELTALVKEIPTLDHRVLYYGPRKSSEVASVLDQLHRTPENLSAVPEKVDFDRIETESKVYWTHYDMVQSEFMFINNNDTYSSSIEPKARLFNEYFGGGMNSIVFQEIREAQGLAYSAFSQYGVAGKKDNSNVLFAYIGTQADKQSEAMEAMINLLNNPPESGTGFETAKKTILSKIETERITKSSILWNYESAKRKGLDYDIRKDIYNDVKSMSLADVMDFHKKYIKDRKYNVVMIGNRDNIDFEDLKKYGEVTELSLEEIFGYGDYEHISTEINP